MVATSFYKPETPMNNLLLTMLDKAGVPGETLGDSTGKADQLSEEDFEILDRRA